MISYILYFLLTLNMSLSHSSNKSRSARSNKPDLRIYNGWAAKLGDVPYQVAFKQQTRGYLNLYATFCGGSIVAPTKLISAAHCFVDNKNNMCAQLCSSGYLEGRVISHQFAVAGQLTNRAVYSRIDSLQQGQWRHLSNVRYPPEYNFPKLDIAIVFIQRPFVFNEYVKSIPYASRFVNYDGKCLASGFGRTSPSTTSSVLLLAHVRVLTYPICSRLHHKAMTHFVCISSQLTDVGKGDSGGPLVCKNTGDPKEGSNGILVGVTSGNRYGVGSFFTRVSSYYNYIERNKSCNESVSCLYLTFLLYLLYRTVLLF